MIDPSHRLVVFSISFALGCPSGAWAARPLIQDPASVHANQTLARTLDAGFERRLTDGFPLALATAVIRAEFTSTADRAHLDAVLKSPEVGPNTTLKFRAFALLHDVHTLTTTTGRTFTMSNGHSPRTIAINGHEIVWAKMSLEKFVTEVEHALHRTYVVRAFGIDALLPRADAAAPLFFVYTMAALALYYAYDSYTSPNYSGPPSAQSAQRLAHVADLCDAERVDAATAFEVSETARTIDELAKNHVVDVAHRDTVKSCDAEVSTVVVKPKELTVPPPNPADVRAACESEARLAACVAAFKARATARDQRVIPPSVGSGSAK